MFYAPNFSRIDVPSLKSSLIILNCLSTVSLVLISFMMICSVFWSFIHMFAYVVFVKVPKTITSFNRYCSFSSEVLPDGNVYVVESDGSTAFALTTSLAVYRRGIYFPSTDTFQKPYIFYTVSGLPFCCFILFYFFLYYFYYFYLVNTPFF